MLQQTRVETVIPYFERFMTRFPTPLALAEAPEDLVLAAWSGLGYYRRARMLHAGAKQVSLAAPASSAATADAKKNPAAAMPADRDGLLQLPGVGRYTAGAIASIAYGEPVSLVDGNVARVLARVFAIEDDVKRAGMRRAETLAEDLVHARDPGAWNQALMELGATICTPRAPSCDRCPIASSCQAHAQDRVAELPLVGAKAKPKPQRVQALVAVYEGRILLARRRSTGLFGGLWEPPSIDGVKRTARKALIDRFPIDATTLDHRGTIVHVLSHRRLTVDVHVAALTRDPENGPRPNLPESYETSALFASSALLNDEKLGVSSLARKILAKAGPIGA